MKKKLLQKTIRPYALYALLVLALSIPAYFMVLNTVWQRELDKHHNFVRAKIEQQMNSLHQDDAALQKTIDVWNYVQPGSQISPATAIKPDRYFNTMRFDSFHHEREQYRTLITHVNINGKPYQLKLETNMEEVDETILIIAGITIFFFIILLSGFIILNRRLSRKLWKPFYNTLQQLRTFDLNEQKKPEFIPADVEEFEELHQTLNKLFDKNISLFRQQKEFTENASHELQTPLAVLKSRLDIVIQDPLLTEEQSKKIDALNIPLSRISRINKNLLLLAKIEHQPFNAEEPLDVRTEISQAIDLLNDHIKNNLIQNMQTVPPVTTNRGLFEIMLNNLLLNTILHTPPDGEIRITLQHGLLLIENTGQQPLHAENLFARFKTSSKGSGLGLAIVKQICARYGWEISYAYHEKMHQFKILNFF